MKTLKALLAALSVTALSSTAMAYEWNSDRVFVGVEGGMGWNSLETEILVNSSKESSKEKENGVKSKFIGARVGTYLQDEFRVYATFSWNMLDDTTLNFNFNKKPLPIHLKDMKQMNFLLSGDYIFMPESQVRPFIGLTLGATQNKASNNGVSKTQWGFAYGAQAGIIIPLDSVDFEIGAKYLGNNASIKASNDDFSPSLSSKINMTHSKQAYLALSFRF